MVKVLPCEEELKQNKCLTNVSDAHQRHQRLRRTSSGTIRDGTSSSAPTVTAGSHRGFRPSSIDIQRSNPSKPMKPRIHHLTMTLLFALVGCGGGGAGDPAPATPATLAGPFAGTAYQKMQITMRLPG